ncbi:MAG: YitT family protein [Bacillales bacterium]|nr:YitT family protein [Bacillales bacterium]
MKTFLKKIKKKLSDYFYDHIKLRIFLEYVFMFMAASLSSLVYAYGYKSFVDPSSADGNIVTGGASGIAQIITLIFEICGVDGNQAIGPTNMGYLIQSIFYIITNIPIAIIAFKSVGKKFAFFTVVNVLLYFVFVNLIPEQACNIYYSNEIAGIDLGFFERALFAGICSGLSSSIAILSGHSNGGVDVVSVFITVKNPNKSIGKVSMLINFCIIFVYTLLTRIDAGNWAFVTCALYSLVYFFVTSVVVDALVTKNRKNQLQIITSNIEVADVLIANFPHSATIVKGIGAFTKMEKSIIYIVLSSYETKRAIKVVQAVDPQAFITVTKVQSLVGRFYMKPNE